MKYVAPVAKVMGYSIEEVSAAIGVMSDAGIKGSMSGTALRGALIRLTKPSKQAKEAMEMLGFKAYDSKGKMKSLADITGELEKRTKKMGAEQKNAAIAAIFGQEALSGMLALMGAGPGKINGLTNSFKNADGAAKEMAKTMMDNTKGAIEEMKGSLETAGIAISKVLAPMITKVAKKVTDAANAFSKLNPKTQEAIVKAAGLVAATGPLLSIGGKVTKGIGNITKLVGTLKAATAATTVATAGMGTAATTAAGVAGAGGIAGFASSLGGVVVAAGPYLLAAAAIGAAGYGIYKGLTQETVPAVDLFADKVEYSITSMEDASGAYSAYGDNVEITTTKISDATKKAVGAYIDMDNDVSNTLSDLYINSSKITENTKKTLIKKYDEMGNTINLGLEKKRKENYSNFQEFFKDSVTLSSKEEAEILANSNRYYIDKQTLVNTWEKEIYNIIERASKEKRKLTSEEVTDINGYQKKMKEEAVKTLSENEVETKVILERMKSYDERITSEQARDHIKKLNESRDKAITVAKEECDKKIAAIIKMRDEAKIISANQADSLIADANRQKDEIISAAEETRNGAVDILFRMNEDLIDDVDSSTGKMITIWDRMFGTWDKWNPESKTCTVTTNYVDKYIRNKDKIREDYGTSSKKPTKNSDTFQSPYLSQEYQYGGYRVKPGHNAGGTNFWTGDWTWVGEQGPELVELPRGSKVLSNQKSMDMVRKIEHTGTIKLEGVDRKGQTMEVVDIILDEIRKEVRTI